jgi:hypothetical protein
MQRNKGKGGYRRREDKQAESVAGSRGGSRVGGNGEKKKKDLRPGLLNKPSSCTQKSLMVLWLKFIFMNERDCLGSLGGGRVSGSLLRFMVYDG